ncbi:hypothetical protein TNCV_2338741 [Trichonephila clavipes]|nr:hypothetical protein TNCV_2338741 [Trichonephila clavipes]
MNPATTTYPPLAKSYVEVSTDINSAMKRIPHSCWYQIHNGWTCPNPRISGRTYCKEIKYTPPRFWTVGISDLLATRLACFQSVKNFLQHHCQATSQAHRVRGTIPLKLIPPSSRNAGTPFGHKNRLISHARSGEDSLALNEDDQFRRRWSIVSEMS